MEYDIVNRLGNYMVGIHGTRYSTQTLKGYARQEHDIVNRLGKDIVSIHGTRYCKQALKQYRRQTWNMIL
jgi:hypothetical protein